VIIADTGGIIALLDADDRHHEAVKAAHEETGDDWLLPWAILPEVDYLSTKYLGAKVALAFSQDILRGAFRVEGYQQADLTAAVKLQKKYSALEFGLVDGIVMAQASRLLATAIVTLDVRHFRAVRLGHRNLRLLPFDR
jgi:predicted nucleic acid-binding protein